MQYSVIKVNRMRNTKIWWRRFLLLIIREQNGHKHSFMSTKRLSHPHNPRPFTVCELNFGAKGAQSQQQTTTTTCQAGKVTVHQTLLFNNLLTCSLSNRQRAVASIIKSKRTQHEISNNLLESSKSSNTTLTVDDVKLGNFAKR